jgi:hypothetical protein
MWHMKWRMWQLRSKIWKRMWIMWQMRLKKGVALVENEMAVGVGIDEGPTRVDERINNGTTSVSFETNVDGSANVVNENDSRKEINVNGPTGKEGTETGLDEEYEEFRNGIVDDLAPDNGSN